MTIAELHGKISRAGENLHNQMEDLLTSDVFSACKYVRPESLLLPFLKTAMTLKGDTLADVLPEKFVSVDYRFWPRLRRSEPDVLITLKGPEDTFTLVLIEAKYMSFKSGAALTAEELEIAQAPGDQLAREYADLMESHAAFNLPSSRVRHRALVYVTAGRTLPADALRESQEEIAHVLRPEASPGLYWTNWHSLHPILTDIQHLEAWERRILEDLRLLVERKGFVAFSGITIPKYVPGFKSGSIYQGAAAGFSSAYDFLTPPPPGRPPSLYSSK